MQNVNTKAFIATGNTITISATGTSSTTAITGFHNLAPESPGNIRVYNAGPDIAWVKPVNASSGTAAKTGDTAIPVPAGNTETFAVLQDTSHIAVIAQTSAATVYVTPGQGA